MRIGDVSLKAVRFDRYAPGVANGVATILLVPTVFLRLVEKLFRSHRGFVQKFFDVISIDSPE